EGPVVQAFYSTGTVQPDREFPIKANVAGTITDVRVDKGDAVTEGQPLAVVSEPGLVFAHRQAQAELEEKQKRADPQSSPVLQEYDARIAAGRTQLEIAQRELARIKALMERNAASQTDLDAAAVEAKFGVAPSSIPDYLALVGDSADGFPGLAGWGAKSAAAVLAHYRHLEAIPAAAGQWEVSVRNSPQLAATLAAQRDQALLFRTLATLRADCPVGTVDEWRWRGPTEAFGAMCERLEAPDLAGRARGAFAAAVAREPGRSRGIASLP
ncbi:MAG: efflux RND transporter periplasmic adaptor subunit, partial [Actinobacteria bacterium]|nr:efflux RND transporter periplasmic adaptor subunit [Actinomycetota bacterium]